MKQKLMGWQPQADNKIGFISGLAGGAYQYILNINLPIDFWSKLVEAGITAIVCGFAGVAGKELYKIIRSAIIKKNKDEKIP